MTSCERTGSGGCAVAVDTDLLQRRRGIEVGLPVGRHRSAGLRHQRFVVPHDPHIEVVRNGRVTLAYLHGVDQAREEVVIQPVLLPAVEQIVRVGDLVLCLELERLRPTARTDGGTRVGGDGGREGLREVRPLDHLVRRGS